MLLNGIQTMQREEKYIIKPITKKREIRMNTFSDYNDLRRFVSERMPGDLTCYDLSYNDLLDQGTDNLKERLEDVYHFQFGKHLPENWFQEQFSNDKWFKLFE